MGVFSGLAAGLSAEPVEYIFTGDTSGGTIGEIGFGSTTVQFDFWSDTSTVSGAEFGADDPSTSTFSAQSVTIGGLGTYGLTDGAYIFNFEPLGIVGFGFGDDYLDLEAGGLTGYNLQSSIGPIGGTAFVEFQGQTPDTTGGVLDLNDITSPTFQAIVGATSVPDGSSTLVLLGTVLMGIAGMRRLGSRATV